MQLNQCILLKEIAHTRAPENAIGQVNAPQRPFKLRVLVKVGDEGQIRLMDQTRSSPRLD